MTMTMSNEQWITSSFTSTRTLVDDDSLRNIYANVE